MLSSQDWTIVPIFLKPDALKGDFISVNGAKAADFAGYLSAVLIDIENPTYAPIVPESKDGFEKAISHVTYELNAFPWYNYPICDAPECFDRLMILHSKWSNSFCVSIADILIDTTKALGFEVVDSFDKIVTNHDYNIFYGDSEKPDMHTKMKAYLIGKKIRMFLLCGQQENSSLQIMKVFARYIMRFAVEEYSIYNWIHVTNPDASNFPELIRLHTT